MEKKYNYMDDPEKRKKHYEYMSQSVTCGCGSTVVRSAMGLHRKSKKHMKWAEPNKIKIDNFIKEINNMKELLIEIEEKTNKLTEDLNELCKKKKILTKELNELKIK